MNKHNAKNIFAMRIKSLREEKGLSQGDLAKEFGVSRGSISYYENAERTADIDFVYKAAIFFGTSVDFLLGKSDLRVSDMDAERAAVFTGLSDKTILALNNIKDYSEYKMVLNVLELLIAQNPPPPSRFNSDSVDSEGEELNEHIDINARYKWKFDYTHSLSKIARYLNYIPNPDRDKNLIIREMANDTDGDNIIEEFSIVSQVNLNDVIDSIRQLRRIIHGDTDDHYSRLF